MHDFCNVLWILISLQVGSTIALQASLQNNFDPFCEEHQSTIKLIV
jgi:hypothetical protein